MKQDEFYCKDEKISKTSLLTSSKNDLMNSSKPDDDTHKESSKHQVKSSRKKKKKKKSCQNVHFLKDIPEKLKSPEKSSNHIIDDNSNIENSIIFETEVLQIIDELEGITQQKALLHKVIFFYFS